MSFETLMNRGNLGKRGVYEKMALKLTETEYEADSDGQDMV
jgi:hypothetical protein